MTLYVKQKIANLLKITNTTDPLVEGGIRVVVGRLETHTLRS